MDSWRRCPLQRFPGACDVFGLAPRESRNLHSVDIFRKQLYRLEVSVGGNGESGFDNIHSKLLELKRHAQLLVHIHAATRRLLSIAQGRIENQHPVVAHLKPSLNRVSQLLTMPESAV